MVPIQTLLKRTGIIAAFAILPLVALLGEGFLIVRFLKYEWVIYIVITAGICFLAFRFIRFKFAVVYVLFFLLFQAISIPKMRDLLPYKRDPATGDFHASPYRSEAESHVLAIKEGELWLGPNPMTKTGGKIDGFSLSLTKRYVATLKIIEQTRPLAYVVQIYDMSDGKMMREITAPEKFPYLGNWVECEEEAYRFRNDSASEAAGNYEYIPTTNEIKKFELADLAKCP